MESETSMNFESKDETQLEITNCGNSSEFKETADTDNNNNNNDNNNNDDNNDNNNNIDSKDQDIHETPTAIVILSEREQDFPWGSPKSLNFSLIATTPSVISLSLSSPSSSSCSSYSYPPSF